MSRRERADMLLGITALALIAVLITLAVVWG